MLHGPEAGGARRLRELPGPRLHEQVREAEEEELEHEEVMNVSAAPPLLRVNSIQVQSSAWICFDQPDFQGQQMVLEPGDYPEFHRWNSINDHMGSCRPVRMVRERGSE